MKFSNEFLFYLGVGKLFSQYEHRTDTIQIHRGDRQSGYPSRFHKHIELSYICSGSLDITVGQNSYTLQSGDIYIVFPNLVHAIERASAVKYMILISPEALPSLMDTLSRTTPDSPIIRKEECLPFIGQLFSHMYTLFKEDQQKNHDILINYANALLCELLQHLTLQPRESNNDLVQKLVVYLLDNYTKDICLDDLADVLGYSKYYISRSICDTFGCNFRNLVNSYRIAMAQNLILSTKQHISQIAFACGFNNQSSFNRIFLAQCGMTPMAYRKSNAKTVTEPHLYLK